MSKKIRMVQVGCGKMAKDIIKYALSKGIEIVGAVDSNQEAIGKDLGSYLGFNQILGVEISNNPREVFENCDADIAVVTIASYIKDFFVSLEIPLTYGVNVLTISEEALYPWTTSVYETNRLDKIAKENNVTISGTGMQDIYWVLFPTLMAAGMNNVKKISGEVSYDVEHYGKALAEAHGVGYDKERFKSEIANAADLPSYSWMAAEAICSKMNWSIKRITQSNVPVILEKEVLSKTIGRRIKASEAIGMSAVVTAETFQGPVVEVGCTGKVYQENEGDLCTWYISGEPSMNFEVSAPDTPKHTCATVINRIPTIINSAPGYITMDQLEEIQYMTYPAHMYLKNKLR